jgi:hypothetical protein
MSDRQLKYYGCEVTDVKSTVFYRYKGNTKKIIRIATA